MKVLLMLEMEYIKGSIIYPIKARLIKIMFKRKVKYKISKLSRECMAMDRLKKVNKKIPNKIRSKKLKNLII